MSHAANKVKWCLDKAKKEITEKRKHRGLVKAAPARDLAYQHLAKAEHNFKAVLYFERGGFTDWSVSAGFYCLYHCLMAVLAKHGYESRNQECTLAAIDYLIEQKTFMLDKKFIDALKQYDESERHETNVIELREILQYGVSVKAESKELVKIKELCKEAIDAVKDIISA
ncbi:HEPN domain-containing protein [Candidatus Woesearchaeota archaeon]|nr:HEPN domain-containing protein [Candidatus Woesearchaeota archaeon]